MGQFSRVTTCKNNTTGNRCAVFYLCNNRYAELEKYLYITFLDISWKYRKKKFFKVILNRLNLSVYIFVSLAVIKANIELC